MAFSHDPDRSNRIVEWSVVAVLSGCLASAVLSPQFIAPLVMLFAVAVTVAGYRRLPPSVLKSAPMIAAVLLLIWAVISIGWSIDAEVSTKRSFRLFLMIVMGALVALYLPRINLSGGSRKAVVCVAWAVIAVIIGDSMMGAPLGQALMDGGDPLDRSGSVLVLLLWPIGVLAHRTFGLKGLAVLAVGTGVAVGILDNKAAILAAVIGGLAFGLTIRWPRIAGIAITASVVLFAAVAPVGIGIMKEDVRAFARESTLDSGTRHRVFIWSFSGEKALDKPLTGWGMGGSRAIPGGETVAEFLRSDGSVEGQGESLPLHPHNGFLQIFLELGLVGIFLIAATLVLLFKRLVAAAQQTHLVAPVVGFAVSALIMASISFGAWQGWWVSILLLTGTILYGLAKPDEDTGEGAKPPVYAAAPDR